uniref:(northern house mosquito) hypothetical protein n=1 Tax=Culex pipiens TaxID=7175 RepID=A0A8D8GBN3_CULPI
MCQLQHEAGLLVSASAPPRKRHQAAHPRRSRHRVRQISRLANVLRYGSRQGVHQEGPQGPGRRQRSAQTDATAEGYPGQLCRAGARNQRIGVQRSQAASRAAQSDQEVHHGVHEAGRQYGQAELVPDVRVHRPQHGRFVHALPAVYLPVGVQLGPRAHERRRAAFGAAAGPRLGLGGGR